jgi:hypothetical protein
VKRQVDVRPWGGFTADPFDLSSFASPLGGMNGQPFTHLVLCDLGTGRRNVITRSTSLERALKAAATAPAAYGDVWVEPYPDPGTPDAERMASLSAWVAGQR